MERPYRGRSRRSETPSSSSSGHSSPQYASVHSGHSNPSYVPVSPYGPYSSQSPPQFDNSTSRYGRHQRPSPPTRALDRHLSYPAPEFASERASKRQRAITTPNHTQIQAQWVDTGRGYNMPSSKTGRLSYKSDRDSPASSGYNSPQGGYSHRHLHGPYGQQILHSPSTGPPTLNMYDMRHPRLPSPDDDYVEHGPTELPPRTYVGKSQYDPPKKPGKIPGSAMDYLPILEARFDRLETAIDKYVDLRGKQALSNSILPGMESYETSSGRGNSSHLSRHPRESSRR